MKILIANVSSLRRLKINIFGAQPLHQIYIYIYIYIQTYMGTNIKLPTVKVE